MKIVLKNVSLILTIVLTGFLYASCGDADESLKEDSKEQAEEKNDSALTSKAAEKDADFVVDVVSSNYGEIKLAQLAQQKSTNAEIKEVAKMLETDHTAVLNELKSLASTKGITVPTEAPADANDKAKELSDDKASEFDKDWCETLMDKHKASINKFENAANDVTDPDLKAWVNNTLPKLRTHHDKLMECHKKLK